MKPELTCAIVRDLLPSYVEGLTSEETNQAVEAHLVICPDCARLRAELAAPETAETAEQRREVDYLKKVKRRNSKRIVLAVLCTLLLVIGGFAASIFLIGSTADVGSMAWEAEVSDDTLYLNVMSSASANAYYGWNTERDENGVINVTVREVLVSAIHPDGSGTVEIPLDDGVTEVRLLGKIIWQDGVVIERSTLRAYEAHTPYVGDTEALGNVARALQLQETGGSYRTSLHTSSRPYEWTVEFQEMPNMVMDYDALSRKMRYFLGPQMLALVDNLDQVSWTYTGKNGEIETHTLTLSRANADLAELIEAGGVNDADWVPPDSIKDYTGSLADFQRLRDLLSGRTFLIYTGTMEVEPPPEGAYHFVS